MDLWLGKIPCMSAALLLSVGILQSAPVAGSWELIGGDGRNGSWTNSRGHDRTRALAGFRGELFVGLGAADSEVWKFDGKKWSQVGGNEIRGSWKARPDSGEKKPVWVNSLLTDDDRHLYAGIKQSEHGAQLWRYDGDGWRLIGGTGRDGDWKSEHYNNVYTLAWHGGNLYAGLQGRLPASGSQYRAEYSNGEIYHHDGKSWERISGDGLRGGWDRSHTTTWIYKLISFRGDLYAAIGRHGVDGRRWSGEVWRLADGRWERIGGSGVRGSWNPKTTHLVTSMIVHRDRLLVGYNCQACPQRDGRMGNVWSWDGKRWSELSLPAIGGEASLVANQRSFNDFAVCQGQLFVGGGRASPAGHAVVWLLDEARDFWRPSASGARSFRENEYVYSMIVHGQDLIVGFKGAAGTGQVWRLRR
ncbi:MAG: hypothetical protein CMO80_23840 [Verrucomicrobiales bacterium]|nr:hypothetical protein [Verrucomicrobiales bacterium]|tara:strand:+ start:15612 stop:16859 length:1248 start_codon:yes stop_codon:yes gene_type:complete